MLNEQFLIEIRLDRARIPNFETYPFALDAVRNLDTLALHESVTFIIGENGSGKSTLIRCINCLELISSGELVVDGIKIPAERRKIRQIRLEVGMVFQQFNLHCLFG